MKEKTKQYTVVVGFPWRGGHWTTVGQPLQLLDCEAGALKRAKKIKLKTVSDVDSIAESDAELITDADIKLIEEEANAGE